MPLPACMASLTLLCYFARATSRATRVENQNLLTQIRIHANFNSAAGRNNNSVGFHSLGPSSFFISFSSIHNTLFEIECSLPAGHLPQSPTSPPVTCMRMRATCWHVAPANTN